MIRHSARKFLTLRFCWRQVSAKREMSPDSVLPIRLSGRGFDFARSLRDAALTQRRRFRIEVLAENQTQSYSPDLIFSGNGFNSPLALNSPREASVSASESETVEASQIQGGDESTPRPLWWPHPDYRRHSVGLLHCLLTLAERGHNSATCVGVVKELMQLGVLRLIAEGARTAVWGTESFLSIFSCHRNRHRTILTG